jgi:hypothetical protein
VFVCDKTKLIFIFFYCVTISDKITCLLQTLLEVAFTREGEEVTWTYKNLGINFIYYQMLFAVTYNVSCSDIQTDYIKDPKVHSL